ncbi:MAG: threonine--tRNA ligase [candidate division SR1 bacterium]|nr:threonine--tRNA ligase [candidate division SR1 bacterium]
MSIPKNTTNFALDVKRHSFSHILAAAVQEMFPEAQFGVGPVIENGCYYDFILPRTLIPEDLSLIEEKIKEMFERDLAFKKHEMGINEAITFFSSRNQPLKVELLTDLKIRGTTKLDEIESEIVSSGANTVTLYRLVDEQTGEVLFEDLCKGPHVTTIKELNGDEPGPNSPIIKDGKGLPIDYKLDKISGTYWRGDQKRNIQMQRIYALVFENDEVLGEFLYQRNEAKKRDHRVLGQQMKLFTISELVGAGLPLMQPKGMIIRKRLEDYLWQLHKNRGYSRVWTPHIAKVELYEASGHAAKFGDELFRVQGKEESFIMKPMNCPHHMQIFADNQFSYRDMPIRYFEPATVYRDEKSGQLSGLTRVRAITQDDGHLFCRINQIGEEVATIVKVIKEFYETMGMMTNYWVSLSIRGDDGKAYLGEDEVWKQAEKALEDAAKDNSLPYKKVEGEAAFYGPKLDFMFKDVLGREWQLATIQCDFNLPERFDLSFINESGEKERPLVIHRAISGSIERFMGILIEHFGGRFPFWLAPEQIRILTINDKVLDYVSQITAKIQNTQLELPLNHNDILYTVDSRAESLGKKIREAELEKVPVIFIVGPKDMEAGEVSVRVNGEEKKAKLEELSEFLKGV